MLIVSQQLLHVCGGVSIAYRRKDVAEKIKGVVPINEKIARGAVY